MDSGLGGLQANRLGTVNLDIPEVLLVLGSTSCTMVCTFTYLTA